MRPNRSRYAGAIIGLKNIIVALSQLHERSPLNGVIACHAKFLSKYSRLADSINLINLLIA